MQAWPLLSLVLLCMWYGRSSNSFFGGSMNLLTLLRTNLYTQKQMGFLLGIKPYRVSELVCLLERRGYIEVNRSFVQGNRGGRNIVINGMNLYKTKLYRRQTWDLEKSLLIAVKLENHRLDGAGLNNCEKQTDIGSPVCKQQTERSSSTGRRTVSVWVAKMFSI